MMPNPCSAAEWAKEHCGHNVQPFSKDTTLPGFLCWLCADAYARQQVEAFRERAAKTIPTNWVDPLLTGEDAVLPGYGPWGCPDIERLLWALAAAIRALEP